MNSKRLNWMAGAALLAMCASLPAGAVVIYDEAVSGDLSTSTISPDLALVAGVNDVLASTGFVPLGQGADPDSFRFTSAFPILSIEYIFSNLDVLSGTTVLTHRVTLQDDSPLSDIDSRNINLLVDTSPVSLFGGALPLAPDTYRWQGDGFSATTSGGGTWDYIVRITTEASAAPEPSALALIGLGLLALAAVRRPARAAGARWRAAATPT